MNKNRSQTGLTLVEILISITISLLLLAGVFTIYSSNKQTYVLQEEMSRLQENARHALAMLTRDIRNAGYTGCMRADATAQNIVVHNPSDSFNPASGIQGWEAAGTGPSQSIDSEPFTTAVTHTTGNNNGWAIGTGSPLSRLRVLPASDIIQLWRASTDSQPITNVTLNSAGGVTSLNLRKTLSLKAGHIALLSDCGHVDYVMKCNEDQVSDSINLQGCNTDPDSGHTFNGNDLVNKYLSIASDLGVARALKTSVYFVSKQGNRTDNPPALFRASLTANTQLGRKDVIAEGVENMQILYGEDMNNDHVANRYVTAEQVTNWRKVVSVKISLLMSTVAKISSNNALMEYDLNGITINPAQDKRIRRVYSSTIAIRNRV